MTSATANDVTVLRLDATRFIIVAAESEMPDLWQKLTAKARPAGIPVWRWLMFKLVSLVTLATKEEFQPQMADLKKSVVSVSTRLLPRPGNRCPDAAGKVKRHFPGDIGPINAGGRKSVFAGEPRSGLRHGDVCRTFAQRRLCCAGGDSVELCP
jgi:hypothetical protein